MALKGIQNADNVVGLITMTDQHVGGGTATKGKKRNHESHGGGGSGNRPLESKTYYNSASSSGGQTVMASGSSSPPARHSPSRSSPPAKMVAVVGGQSSPGPGGFFAGAKFSEPPSPGSLPKPPSHWVGTKTPARVPATPCFMESRRCSDISDRLKVLLKVRA